MHMFHSTRRGFTLIELLVVVLIIGILAAVALPKYQLAVLKSRYATLKNLTKSLANAQEVFYLANGSYATTQGQLDVTIPNSIYCPISTNAVQCYHTSGNSYRIYLLHQEVAPGTAVCFASTDPENAHKTALRQQVCKIETGQKSPNTTTTGYTSWYYPKNF